ncbi:MAG TPA: HEAT repeat domain-containing protein [Labilithrix sp.]|nr:HEAT repeat domain-containing protein [Labilithrix sp.]
MNKTFLSLTFGLVLVGASTTVAGNAHAAGRDAPGFRMPATSFVELKRDVAKARSIAPQSFVAVREVVARAADANARARGRKAPIAHYLAKLGPSALMPMLEMLALDAPKGVPAEAAPSVRRDLIEAVGLLKDAHALPVLSAILADKTEDPETTRTVTEAMARIGHDEAASHILSALQSSNAERARAIIAGMGECRKLHVAEALASRLRGANDDATARAAARSLGRIGNAWAWKTVADRTDEATIRELAARALIDAFVQHTGEERAAASNALMVVDAPETPGLIAAAKSGKSPEIVAALDGLAARFAANPTRTR